MITADQAKRKVEELMGRLDALKSEINHAQAEVAKYKSQNLMVEAREAEQDLARLVSRKGMIETELNHYKKYW